LTVGRRTKELVGQIDDRSLDEPVTPDNVESLRALETFGAHAGWVGEYWQTRSRALVPLAPDRSLLSAPWRGNHCSNADWCAVGAVTTCGLNASWTRGDESRHAMSRTGGRSTAEELGDLALRGIRCECSSSTGPAWHAVRSRSRRSTACPNLASGKHRSKRDTRAASANVKGPGELRSTRTAPPLSAPTSSG